MAFFATSVALVWEAWFREPASGDAATGDAYLAPYFSGAALVAAPFLVLFSRYRPQDWYWGYATIGTVIGFSLQH